MMQLASSPVNLDLASNGARGGFHGHPESPLRSYNWTPLACGRWLEKFLIQVPVPAEET